MLCVGDELPRDSISCHILSLLLRILYSSHLSRFLDMPSTHEQSLNACRLVRLLGHRPLLIILGCCSEFEGMFSTERGRSRRADV